MLESDTIETLLRDHPAVEAVLRLSRDGLPLQFFSSHGDASAEEISSIAGQLFAVAAEAGVIPGKNGIRLFIRAEHGAMYLRELGDATIFCALTRDDSTEQTLDGIFEYSTGVTDGA